MKGAREIDREHAIPVFIAGLHQRREHRNAGIIDERVQPAEAPADGGDRSRHRGGVGDVAGKRERMVGGFERGDRALQQLALDVEQRHAPPLGQEAFCNRKPDAARGAGHQCDFLGCRRH
jgi:hypothetical protein